jgi:hypothetical protein
MALQCMRTACQMAGMATSEEVPVKNGRADFAIYELGAKGRTYTDVSIVHPGAKTYIKKSKQKKGHAAEVDIVVEARLSKDLNDIQGFQEISPSLHSE